MFNKYFKIKDKEVSGNPFAIQTGKKEYGRMQTSSRGGWEEEVYMPEAGSNATIGRSFNFSKLPILGVLLLLLILILITKTAWLQIVKGDYYYSMAEGNRIRVERIEPKRGIIYDNQYRVIARNKANLLLYIIPADLPKDKNQANAIISQVSGILGVPNKEQIEAELAKIKKYSLESYQPLFITDNIEYEKAMRLYLESANWPGVVLSNRTRREYLFTGNFIKKENEKDKIITFNSLSHILGYTGKINPDELKKFGQEYLPIDYIGKMGIEYFWENELKGKSGNKQIEVDALGKEKKIISESQPEDGHNLVLSINLDQQLKLEEIVSAHLKELKLTKASAVVMNPSNGEILAIVSLPSFNNNDFAQGISQEQYNALASQPDKPLFNRAVSGEFPSGSTIKPVMAAAALQEGVITEDTTVKSVGGIRIGQWFFPDYLAGGHGVTDVKKAIALSVNTFFYYIGGGYESFTGLGVDRIEKYFKLFGLGSQTGVDLAGEASGFVPSPAWKEEAKGERWYIGDTYHISIGQGDLLVTPLQVAAYTSYFANSGKLYRPHFIHQILSANDTEFKELKEEPVKENIISENNVKIVREAMQQTVLAGSARRLLSIGATAAGKTGTAQWSTKSKPHAWFTGFAPFENPEVVITILVEEGGEGHLAAVPIAEEYLKWYFGEYKTLIKK
jgi:penicillin-binding protein 2